LARQGTGVLGWIVVLLAVGLLTLLLYPLVSQPQQGPPSPSAPPPTVAEGGAAAIQTPLGPIAQPVALAILAVVGLGAVVGMGAVLAGIVFVLDRIMAASQAHASEAPPLAASPPAGSGAPPPQPPAELSRPPLEQVLDRWADQPMALPRLELKLLAPLVALVLVGAWLIYLIATQGLPGSPATAPPPPPPSTSQGAQATPAQSTAAPPAGGQGRVGTDLNTPLPPGNAARGEELFKGATPLSDGQPAGCPACHSLTPGQVIVGPSLAGSGTYAATRRPGYTAEKYLRESIVQPHVFAPPGFEDKINIMPDNFGQRMSPQDLADIIAYLESLK